MSKNNNSIVHIKLYDTTRTTESSEVVGINKFFLPKQQNGANYSKMNNLSNIINKLMRQFIKYKIEPGTTIILYIERNENIHIISQIINICLWLKCPLLFEIYDAEDKSYSAPVLTSNSDDCSVKYLNRVSWYVQKVDLLRLDEYLNNKEFKFDEETEDESEE